MLRPYGMVGMRNLWIVVIYFLTACAAPPPRSYGMVESFFTTTALVVPDVAQRRPVSPLLTAVITDIDAARTSVDLAVFDLDLPDLGAALVRAQRRGIRVRTAFDRENLTSPEMAWVVGDLQRAGTTVALDERSAFMHHKFIIIDARLVWLGSWNMTSNDTYRNNNAMVRLVSPALARVFTAEADDLTAGRFGRNKLPRAPVVVQLGARQAQVYFSPGSGANAALVARITAARRSVVFLAFSYTSPTIGAAMVGRTAAGVSVRGVFERRGARAASSQIEPLRAAGAAVLDDSNCYNLHHKLMVIDGRYVVVGSYNFTGNAETQNDEHLLIIDDPVLARAFTAEFDRVYAQALLPQRC